MPRSEAWLSNEHRAETETGEKARSDPQLVFTSLYHHIYDVDNLRACFEALPADRAVGVDGVTKEQYGENLEANLKDLSARLRRMVRMNGCSSFCAIGLATHGSFA